MDASGNDTDVGNEQSMFSLTIIEKIMETKLTHSTPLATLVATLILPNC